jgi:hypothetical protein
VNVDREIEREEIKRMEIERENIETNRDRKLERGEDNIRNKRGDNLRERENVQTKRVQTVRERKRDRE